MLNALFATNPANWSTVPLRFTLGPIMMVHGSQKLFGWFDGHGMTAFADFIGNTMHWNPPMLWAMLGAYGEFVGGLLVLLGLLTRFGAFNTAATMVVAIIAVHWGKFLLPEGIEYALTLFGISVALMLTGGGALSVDRAILAAKRTQVEQQR